MESELHNAHDKGYKYILSIKRLFVQLLKSFVDQGWVNKIEPEDVELVDKSFILPDFKNKEADLVYKVKMEGVNVYFYLLELQSSVDYQMPYRLLLYMVEIWRNVLKETDKREAHRKDFRLPVIIPCVLYNGSGNWTAKRSFKETLFKFEQFDEFVLDFKYILFDVRRYKDEELLELANLIATVFFIDKTKDKSTDLINRLKEVATKMQNLSGEDLNVMCNWIKNIVSRGLNSESKREIEDIFQKKGTVKNMVYGIERVIKKEKLNAKLEGRMEGIKEGIKEGREEEKKATLYKTAIRLLTKRFGELSEEIKSKLSGLEAETLEIIIDSIFEYENLDDVKKYI